MRSGYIPALAHSGAGNLRARWRSGQWAQQWDYTKSRSKTLSWAWAGCGS
jgi:hypothetical protein